ncbi:hypothetical protein [Aurantiacibacter suaedae]|uniref:hypothetical protein n=1 Tax=Aurantiacibacter suaedae TaxID=2545755 RepID=UPI0010F6C1C5|nr:hypothetical protein [Aurantiacibacter suaedae]
MQKVTRLGLALAGLAAAVPANAQSDLEKGLAAALRGCEEWVLNPASWAEGLEPFLSAVGLGDQMGLVERVDEAALPPRELRAGNHYWRINSTVNAGYILVVSDQIPMCHITGGGGSDLQPVVETLLDSADFQSRWEEIEENSRGEMASTLYRSREDPAFSMVVSRANGPGQRLDRVQVLASAMFSMGG